MRSNFFKNLMVLFTFLSVGPPGLLAQKVNVDLSKEHQIIRGFGGINFPSWIGDLTADNREKAFGNAPGEIGLSILRMHVNPDATQFNRELTTAKYAQDKGAILFASPWNPPSHMRVVLQTVNNETDYMLLPEYYADYVKHLNSFVDYMKTNGVPLYAISVQNEPDWHGWTWWTPEQMLKFVREYANGINCRVIAPESLGYVRKMIDPLLKDSVANSHIDILGTHLYGTQKANFYYPLAYEKGKEIWMTEHLMGSDKPEDNTWNLAMELADEINLSMDARMSAFVYWYIRRFYGLIDEAGNITDKGYVMSHFSKFIRPGSYRVDVNYNTATNVTTTAYKSDSSIVFVVVNKGTKSVNLDFAISNNTLGIDSLTKITTSDTKKMVNEGTYAINTGTFSASIDAKSITTFTSNAKQAAKYGNIKPTASGGGNVSIIDTLGKTYTIALKGSESTDPDGKIVKYSWARNGSQISTLPDIEVKHSIGNYQYQLTVTDNDGATATTIVSITISNQNSAEIWLETECASVGNKWDIKNEATCSNGKYVTVKPAFEAKTSATTDSTDYLIYRFYAPEKGAYKVWGRALAPNADDDSFWVKMNNGDWINWNGIVGGSTWQWDDVHNASNDSPMIYNLEVGHHTLYICFRENGASLDKLYITNTGKTPTGLGSAANNCNTGNSAEKIASENTLRVYPNPVKNDLQIESTEPFTSLVIYNSVGSVVFRKSYTSEKLIDNIRLDVENGIYMLQTTSGGKNKVLKFIVSK